MVTAVIAAAGSGQRLGAGGPKALVPLAGRPMVEWSIAAFRAATSVGAIVVACPPNQAQRLKADDLTVVDGGETRSASVANALRVVDAEVVAIHDAARPLLTAGLIESLIAELTGEQRASGVIAAAPLTDTVKRANHPRSGSGPLSASEAGNGALVVAATLDRNSLWAAQTPQVFRTGPLRAALADDGQALGAATDEAMMVEAAGGRVLIHPCGEENLKVTTPLDLRLAELVLHERTSA